MFIGMFIELPEPLFVVLFVAFGSSGTVVPLPLLPVLSYSELLGVLAPLLVGACGGLLCAKADVAMPRASSEAAAVSSAWEYPPRDFVGHEKETMQSSRCSDRRRD